MNLERVHVLRGRGVAEAAQSGEEAGLVAQRGAGVVVGMAALPVGQNHHARALLANDARNLDAVGVGVFDPAIGDVERFAPRDLQNARRVGGFAGAAFGGTTRAQFALREIEDAGARALARHLQ